MHHTYASQAVQGIRAAAYTTPLVPTCSIHNSDETDCVGCASRIVFPAANTPEEEKSVSLRNSSELITFRVDSQVLRDIAMHTGGVSRVGSGHQLFDAPIIGHSDNVSIFLPCHTRCGF